MSQSTTHAIPDFVSRNRDAVIALCHKYDVGRLELFGSAVTDAFNPETSDLDFLIEFLPEKPISGRLRAYLGFKEDLEALFGRPVDLIFVSEVRNPYVKREIENERILFYAA